MSLVATFEKMIFQFKRPSGTSRGILTDKKAWFISIHQSENPNTIGIGECSIIPGLSPDYIDDALYEKKVQEVCANIEYYANHIEELEKYPSIYFGVEMALLDLKNGGKQLYFPSSFTAGKSALPINGLVWMGSPAFMQAQIEEKIDQGFTCIKMKIGAIDFKQEVELLRTLRERFSHEEITLRVDANGAFSPRDAMEKLNMLSSLHIHSIEQPIAVNQREQMTDLCQKSPVSIALDEELIGCNTSKEKKNLLSTIQPQYIILKPSLIGGFQGTTEWIEIAEELNIDWWITSALESNIGLNAIAQFTANFEITLPQGLGTGALYSNNISSPLYIENGYLKYSVT